MSFDEAARLVVMANQIARFFASQKGPAAAAIADHIKAFWEPMMREKLIAVTRAGGQGLDPMVVEAVALLQTAAPGEVRQILAQAGEPTARAPGDDAG